MGVKVNSVDPTKVTFMLGIPLTGLVDVMLSSPCTIKEVVVILIRTLSGTTSLNRC
jgi:hypothetical protein